MMTFGMRLVIVRMMILVEIMRSKNEVNIAQLIDAWLRWVFLFRR